MKSCHEFRERLSAALVGNLSDAPLAWHRHLFGCQKCRALFEAEEALNLLLARLPTPELPVDLAQRVLRRLAAEQELALDQTLDRALVDSQVDLPENLSARVLAGVKSKAARTSLDEVLDRLESPQVPSGLAQRVLQAVEGGPAVIVRRDIPAWRRPLTSVAAAAVLFAVFVGYRNLTGPGEPPLRGVGETARATNSLEVEALPDPDLLAALDLLEDWELLVLSDADLLLGSLNESELELLLLDQGDASSEEEEG